MSRSQKAMRRHLSRPISSDFAQNQRTGGHHALEQRRSGLLSTHISKTANVKRLIAIHDRVPVQSFNGNES